jgi:hypothetical protein
LTGEDNVYMDGYENIKCSTEDVGQVPLSYANMCRHLYGNYNSSYFTGRELAAEIQKLIDQKN